MATPLGQLLHTLRTDPEVRRAVRNSPEEYLDRHGWGDLDSADLQEALLLMADAAPHRDAVGWISAGDSVGQHEDDPAGALVAALDTLGGDVDHLHDDLEPAAFDDPADLDDPIGHDDPADLDDLDDLGNDGRDGGFDFEPTADIVDVAGGGPSDELETDVGNGAHEEDTELDLDQRHVVDDDPIGTAPIDDPSMFPDGDEVTDDDMTTISEPDWDDPT